MSVHHGPPGWVTQTTTTNTATIPTNMWTATGTTTANVYPLTIGGTSTISPNWDTVRVATYTPSYTDLVEGLRPGTEWFDKGTVLRLKNSLFLWGKDDGTHTICLAESVFVYIGVIEDLSNGQERHWFLTNTGRIVQYWGWVYDLSWRGHIRRMFRVIEEKQ